MLPNVGPTELVILLSILLLFFGARRIPELARSLGSGIREFRKGASGESENRASKDHHEELRLEGERKAAASKDKDENARVKQLS